MRQKGSLEGGRKWGRERKQEKKEGGMNGPRSHQYRGLGMQDASQGRNSEWHLVRAAHIPTSTVASLDKSFFPKTLLWSTDVLATSVVFDPVWAEGVIETKNSRYHCAFVHQINATLFR